MPKGPKRPLTMLFLHPGPRKIWARSCSVGLFGLSRDSVLIDQSLLLPEEGLPWRAHGQHPAGVMVMPTQPGFQPSKPYTYCVLLTFLLSNLLLTSPSPAPAPSPDHLSCVFGTETSHPGTCWLNLTWPVFFGTGCGRAIFNRTHL